MSARKTIVLYSPHFVSPAGRESRLYRAVPPLSHLALAGTLRQAGYDVRILDAKWDTDWRSQVHQIADRLLCVGVTSLTRPAVSDGLESPAMSSSSGPTSP